MRVALKNKTRLLKLKQPLPIIAMQIAKAWEKKKSAFNLAVNLTSRKKITNIEDRSLEEMRIAVWVGGKQGNDYNYQNLHEVIEEVVDKYPTATFDRKKIKIIKDEPK